MMVGDRGEGSVGERPVVDELEETWRSIDDLGRALEAADWDRPTDCPGWTVRDNLSHVVGTEAALLGRETPPEPEAYGPHVHNDIGRLNERWIEARRGRPGDQVLEELREVAAARLEVLRAMGDEEFLADSWTPTGPGTHEGFMHIRVFDCWAHEQDMRRAVGKPGHLSGSAAERAMTQLSTGLPYVVGKRAGAPDGSTVVFDVHGPVARTIAVGVEGGRARALDAVPDTPTVRIVADFETFATLVCGRRDPAQALADRRVRLEGDEALGRTVTEHLAYIF